MWYASQLCERLAFYLRERVLQLLTERHGWGHSVTVDLDFLLDSDALLDQELVNVASVVALKLNNIAPLRVLCGRTVAAPRLFKVARQFFHVQVLGQASHIRQALTSISLLEVQVNDVVLGKVGVLLLRGVFADVLGVAIDGVVVAQDQVLVFILAVGLT